MRKKIFVFTALITLGSLGTVFGQGGLLNVFVDCQCDLNYIRQELPYVNYVRDQAQADVQVFINSVKNGSGGTSYALDFKGANDFQDIEKRLFFETTPITTRDEERSGLAQKISLGLVHYLVETDLANSIQINIPEEATAKKPIMTGDEDPWKNWIFEIYGQG